MPRVSPRRVMNPAVNAGDLSMLHVVDP